MDSVVTIHNEDIVGVQCIDNDIVVKTKDGFSIYNSIGKLINECPDNDSLSNLFDKREELPICIYDDMIYVGNSFGIIIISLKDFTVKQLSVNGGSQKLVAIKDFVISLDVAGRITCSNFKRGRQVSLTGMPFNRDIQIVDDKILVWRQNKEILLIPQKIVFQEFDPEKRVQIG